MAMSKWLLLSLCLLSLPVLAQEHRYVVYFSDKNESPYSLDAPEAYLSTRALERRAAQQIALSEEDFPPNPQYIDSIASLGADTFFRSRWMNLLLVQTTPAIAESIATLEFVDSVAQVGKDVRLNARMGTIPERGPLRTTRNSDLSTEITYVQNELIGVVAMHSRNIWGAGIRIAVFDGGFSNVDVIPAFSHLYEEGRLLAAFNFVRNDSAVYDYSDHGTRVLSTLAGMVEERYTGVVPDAEYLLYLTEDVMSEQRIEEYNWLFAAEAADSAGVDVINASLGYYDFDSLELNYTHEDLDGITSVVSRAADLAASKGMVVVLSCGNEGNTVWETITVPADAAKALAVGSVNDRGAHSGFSSVGPTADGRIKPEVVAFGEGTAIVRSTGNIGRDIGTSFAAPQVAGLAAGIWQLFPDLSAEEIKDLIIRSGSQYESPDSQLGYGIPSFVRVAELMGVTGLEVAASGIALQVYPNPLDGDRFVLEGDGFKAGERILLRVTDPQGKTVVHQKERSQDGALKLEFDLSGRQGGMFIISLTNEQGQQETLRLLKK